MVKETSRPPTHVPLVRTAILGPVIKAYEAQGGDAAKVLESHGLFRTDIEDAKAFAPNDTIYSIFQNIAEHTASDFCAKVGENTDWSVFLRVSPKLYEAANLGDFIIRVTAAISHEVNAISLSLLIEGDAAYFTVKRKFRPTVSPAQSDAYQLSMWIALLHRVLDVRWEPNQLVARVHDPKALPKDFYGLRPIGCDSMGYSFRFPAEWLSLKISPEILNPTSRTYPIRDLTAPGDLLSSVESVLRARLGDARLDVTAAAMACGYNVDTLNRRLSAYGTNISTVLSNLRRENAEAALTKGIESATEIAQRLGYSDATAFSRAFKKWTGSTPTEFKKRTLNDL